MKKAVVQFLGSQFFLSEGEELLVDRLKKEKGERLTCDQVLLFFKDNQLLLGDPFLKGAKVVFSVLDHLKGDKIRVIKYKAKSRYRRVKGFRAFLTKLRVEEIVFKAEEQKKKIKQRKEESYKVSLKGNVKDKIKRKSKSKTS